MPGIPWLVLLGASTSRVTLLDSAAPTGSLSGPAVVDATWVGSERLVWQATDAGGGVYRLGLDVDGRRFLDLPAADNGGRCVDADPSNGDSHEFLLPLPCPLSASGDAAIDTTSMPNGNHEIRVFIEDAGGNEVTVLGPANKDIANDFRARGYFAAGQFFNPRLSTPRVINGEGGGEGGSLRASLVSGRRRLAGMRIAFGRRARVRGTLRNAAGGVVKGAILFRAERVAGGEWRLDGSVRTRRDGSFTFLTPARRPSRDLRVVYFPVSDSNRAVLSRTLGLGVRAGLTLKVDRRRTRNGGRIVFSGRVLGTVPDRGVAVSLQAKVGRHFQTFRLLRTSGRAGRLRTVYRFTNTRQLARYRFRLKLIRQAGLPFESGTSRTVLVTVRP